MRPTRPLYFMLNLAGSGHDFRGVCFSVAYTTPNGKSCRTFPKTRSIYHNVALYVPCKTPSIAFWRKKRKKTRKHQAKPEKRARIVFRALHNYARKRPAIGFVCSEYRTGQNDTFSLPQWSVLYRDFCSPIHYSDYRVSKLKTGLFCDQFLRI